MVKSAGAFQTESSGELEHAESGQTGAIPAETDSVAPLAFGVDSGLQTLFEYDPATGQLSWSDNAAAARIFGVSEDNLTSTLDALNAKVTDPTNDSRTIAFTGQCESYSCEYKLLRDGQPAHWVEERGGWIGAGESRRLISVIRSIESQKQREERLSWLAENDELTGLLNRTSLRKHLEGCIQDLTARGGVGAYLLVGIDDIGAVNADFGFESADKAIVDVAHRLQSAVGDDAYIGRVAGTKFGIVIPDCDDEGLREHSVNILNAVREDVIATKAGAIAASVCIGAVKIPEQAEQSSTAMTCGEAALDSAKRLGKSSWSTFSEKTDTVSMRRRNSYMSDIILTALNEKRVRLAFQPIVADLDEKPHKFECLIRMRGEDGKEIPAPDFIPAAERLGLVHLLDRRVLELACNTLAVRPDIHLNVNISMETVKDFVWAEGYISLLRANQNLADRITVELTETQVIDAIDASIEFVSEIKKLGCSFGIDDFGAGYTSFRNLKAMDIDILKIDGSFVTGVSSSRENQLFVRTLLDLARNFGMKTVAEWVDNEADAMLLKGLGVDFLQGFLLGKPLTNPDWLPEGAPNERPSSLDRS